MSEALQFIGRNCFLVLATKSDEYTKPEVEIHILEHSTDEDNVPKQKLFIKGKKDLEAARKAINWALNQNEPADHLLG